MASAGSGSNLHLDTYDDPNTLDEYKVVHDIEKGGFGLVQLLEHKATGEPFVLKKISIKSLKKGGFLRCMARERRASRELTDSPFVVKIFSSFVAGDILNFIMELLDHGDLLDHMTQVSGFNFECTQFYAAELVCGLEYLRSKNWVHRDLKCENLLVTANWHLKIADFGLAKKVGEPSGNPDEIKPSTNVGTPMFKAPEVYKREPTTFNSDLWGLGICIYHMYIFRDPFDGEGTNQLKVNIINGWFRVIPRTAKESVRNIIIKLLKPGHQDRLGAASLQEVKDHAMFDEIFSWETLHTQRPPRIYPDNDRRYQMTEMLNQDLDDLSLMKAVWDHEQTTQVREETERVKVKPRKYGDCGVHKCGESSDQSPEAKTSDSSVQAKFDKYKKGKNYQHNKKTLKKLIPGDRVEFVRGLISHWGVYVGNKEIVHLWGDGGENWFGDEPIHTVLMFTPSGFMFDKALIRKDNFWRVVGKDKAYKNNQEDEKWEPQPINDVVQRAESSMGHEGYNVLQKNCEHFVNWCRYLVPWSGQAEMAKTGLAVAGGMALATFLWWALSPKKEDSDKEEEAIHDIPEKKK